MPELPEVETIKNDLLPMVSGRQIEKIDLVEPSIVWPSLPQDFISRISGRVITGIERRGKYLIFRLDKGYLIMHMRMTGSLLAVGPGADAAEAVRTARIRAVLSLDDGSRLFFFDRRGLGKMWAVERKEEVVGKLGPETLLPDFTPEVLESILSRHRSPVKAVLVDQQFIAGIGNMYADEALFLARINPITPADRIPRRQVKLLHGAIRDVLQAGIEGRGASIESYFRPSGTRGEAHLRFRVAHRLGQPCPVCGTPIQRVMIRGRGSYFCPKDQPLVLPRPAKPVQKKTSPKVKVEKQPLRGKPEVLSSRHA